MLINEYMNYENIEYVPHITENTIEELATLYQMGELEISDIPEDIEELIINNEI